MAIFVLKYLLEMDLNVYAIEKKGNSRIITSIDYSAKVKSTSSKSTSKSPILAPASSQPWA
jgi:hypothetical protein